MASTFIQEHNRLFSDLTAALGRDINHLSSDANGGKSILFVYPPVDEEKYIEEAKRRYTDGYELALVKKTLELYDVNAACYFEQHLMALSCDNHDDICCRILYGDKFCDAYYSPYVCRVLNAGNLPVPGDLEYKVEKTYKLPDREIMSFMLACATLRYCSDKHYREFLCDFEPPCFMVNG